MQLREEVGRLIFRQCFIGDYSKFELSSVLNRQPVQFGEKLTRVNTAVRLVEGDASSGVLYTLKSANIGFRCAEED